MTYRFTILAIIGLMIISSSICAETKKMPQEAEQVLFIIDDSSSMAETAFDPGEPNATRWEVVQRVFPEWLEKFGTDVLVGAVSVGGICGSTPDIHLSTGTDRTNLKAIIGNSQPHGKTNLNAVLEESPQLFNLSIQGRKRIVLLSDGMNTCPPMRSTCEIARELYSKYGITIDVVAWITEPGMEDEFRCVAKSTGGTFFAPKTIKDWRNISLTGFDPWPYVVLILGFATLLLASRITYRHAFHVLHLETALSTLAGGVLLLLGSLILYLVLFVKSGPIAALLGIVVLAAILILVSRRKSQPSELSSNSATPWTAIGITFLVALLYFQPLVETQALQSGSTLRIHGQPLYHHILALDQSGSVNKSIYEMKLLLARYAEMYTIPGEELSLVGFACDEAGTVKELLTFTIPENGSTFVLNRILDDLYIQNPKKTKTYYKPLADFLNEFLKNVKLQPVIMVVSDGKSDGFQDAQAGLISFKEIPFESFGIRGIYAAPGIKDWKVAIAGGNGLDLTTLFQKPITVRSNGGRSYQLLSPVIEPDLIDPILFVETDDILELRPTINPFSHRLHGKLTLHIHNDRIARFRTFRVELRRGNNTIGLGGRENVLIDQNLKEFIFPVTLEEPGQEASDAIIQVILEQGGGTNRTVYPQRSAATKIREMSYWSAFWGEILMLSLAIFVLLAVIILTLKWVAKHRRNRKEIIQVLGGSSIPLARSQTIMMGGEGCQVNVPGVPPGLVLAALEWTGVKEELILRPWNGIQTIINGTNVVGSFNYRLGQPIQFAIDGNTYDVTLYQGTNQTIGIPGTYPANFGNSLNTSPTFSNFSDIESPDKGGNGQFVFGGINTDGGSKTDPNTYI